MLSITSNGSLSTEESISSKSQEEPTRTPVRLPLFAVRRLLIRLLVEMLKDDHEQTAARSSKKMNTTSENLEPTSNTFSREAFFISFASSARSLLASLPPAASPSPAIMVTGGFRTRTGMAQALSSSSTDFVGVGRPACVDPALPIKLLDAKLSAGEARSPIYSVKGAELLRLIPLGVVMAGAGTIWHTMVLAIVARGSSFSLCSPFVLNEC